ncbi:hypothetical protein AWH62_04865 [Maricaulis sp. W15]|uniref:hypothetical protein n=1 Tax=Maricaulis sp. W15 TaxID=1772333 RepID=UPI000948D8FB|nr:hypothetical protein [Maricaulis sp. W15]OLF77999.1 hypothetical protein AWH62_04865 [Maricaulis sp. W15]
MKEYLEPVFQLLTGLGWLVFLLVMMRARTRLRSAGGVLLKLAMMVMPLGFLIIARGGAENTLNKASTLWLAGGGTMAVSLLLLATGVWLLAGREAAAKD